MKLLYKGVSNDDVKAWQTFLNDKGFDCGPTDGKFGGRTERATIDYQTARALIPDGIVGKITILKAVSEGFQEVPTFERDIDAVVVHITATAPTKTVEQIKREHLERGFSDIGYHWLVDQEGKVHAGRPEEVVGAHVEGYNAHTIGIAYIARGKDDRPNDPYGTYMSEKQREQLELKVAEILSKYKLTIYDVYGHNDYTFWKACPCFKVKKADEFLNSVKELM